MYYYLLAALLTVNGKGGSANDSTSVNNIPTLSASDFITNALNITYYLLGAIAVIMIIVAGITYVISAGNSSAVAKAKNTITYAIVGLIVVILAFVITNYVVGVFK